MWMVSYNHRCWWDKKDIPWLTLPIYGCIYDVRVGRTMYSVACTPYVHPRLYGPMTACCCTDAPHAAPQSQVGIPRVRAAISENPKIPAADSKVSTMPAGDGHHVLLPCMQISPIYSYPSITPSSPTRQTIPPSSTGFPLSPCGTAL